MASGGITSPWEGERKGSGKGRRGEGKGEGERGLSYKLIRVIMRNFEKNRLNQVPESRCCSH